MAERKAFLLRLPPRLHQALKAWAEDEMRSLNGHIEYLLRDAVRRRDRRAVDEDPPSTGGGGDGAGGGQPREPDSGPDS